MSSGNEITEKISKKSWSGEEDAKLLKLVAELGINGSWTLISARMGNRSGKQCRERYHNHLKSEINKSPFTKEEDDLVNELQRKMGNQWAKISKHFNGRSDNAVKNRWHIINRNRPEVPWPPVTCTPPLAARKHPLVPKLALPSAPAAIVPSLNLRTVSEGADLQSLYHSHDHHCHEITDSSRSTLPSSGRRSSRSGRSASSFVAERFTVTMEQAAAISSQFKTYPLRSGVASKPHTVSVSDSSSSEDEDEESENDNEDSWLDDLIASCSEEERDDWSCDDADDVLSYSQEDLSTLLNNNVFAEDSIISPREDTEHILIEEANSLPVVETPNLPLPKLPRVNVAEGVKVYDTFSEAALTHREDPDEADYDETESRDCYNIFNNSNTVDGDGDEDDDLFLLFEDTMSICSKPSPQQYVSPQDRFKAYINNKNSKWELTPRTTPRSPACPNVKRQRGIAPGGSPFRISA